MTVHDAAFEDYRRAQADADAAFRDPQRWWRMAVLNTARMGFFSSDRSIRDYMEMIWGTDSAL